MCLIKTNLHSIDFIISSIAVHYFIPYKKAVHIGKFVLLFECFIIPVFGLIRRCGLWKHDVIHMMFVALATGICSVLFLVITQKHIPFIYMEKKENS